MFYHLQKSLKIISTSRIITNKLVAASYNMSDSKLHTMGAEQSKKDKIKQTVGSLLVVAASVGVNAAIGYISSEPMSFTNIVSRLGYFTIGVQWLVFLHAGGIFGNKPTEKYYDLTGALTYLATLGLSIFYAADHFSTRQIIVSTFSAIWSIRLGTFLFMRIHKNSGIDSRFTEMKQSIPRFLVAWTIQGVWVFLTLLPINLLNQNSDQSGLGVFDYIGIPLWVIGFLIESVADHQKNKFRSDPNNKDKWITSGLWSISRHPNYFGEIMLWTGVALSCFGGMPYDWRCYMVFVSPAFVALLLNFVSGIPLLERKSDKLYGNIEEYNRYKEKTPVLIPFIGRKGDFKICKC